MAEGLLGAVLGEEEEKPELEAPEALASAEAFAAAVAAIASRQDPQVARDTSTFLRDQSELLRVQKGTLKTNTRCGSRTFRARNTKASCVAPASGSGSPFSSS